MTDQYPRGKLNDSDEGALKISLNVIDKTVVIDFGKEITWLGMSKQEAIELAKIIIERANEIK